MSMPVSDPPIPFPDDAALMSAVARGDHSAFAELIRRHQGTAWRLACRFLGDRAEAEDIVQEAFLRILGAAARYRPDAAFRTYLHTVVGRLCLDHARRRRPEYPGEVPDCPTAAPGPSEMLEAAEQRAAVRRALDDLPPKQRLAFLLQQDEGMGYAAIGQVLGVSTRAVEGLVRRAREGLAARLTSTECLPP